MKYYGRYIPQTYDFRVKRKESFPSPIARNNILRYNKYIPKQRILESGGAETTLSDADKYASDLVSGALISAFNRSGFYLMIDLQIFKTPRVPFVVFLKYPKARNDINIALNIGEMENYMLMLYKREE